MTTTAPHQRGSLPLGIVMGVVVGAIAVMLVWFLVIDDPDQATPAPSPSPTSTRTASPSPSAVPSATPTPTPTATPTPTPSATPGESPSAEPGDYPGIVTDLPVGSWITVLDSPSQASTTPEQALARAAELSRNGYQAVPVDTNQVGGMNRGYWAIAVVGHSSRAEANAVCEALGLAVGNDCYGRQVKG